MAQKIFMTVVFLGLIISPMSFHLAWFPLYLNDGTGFVESVLPALSGGLLFSATLVICADTIARGVSQKNDSKKWAMAISICILLVVFIAMLSTKSSMNVYALSENARTFQVVFFVFSILLSGLSITAEPRNIYLGRR